MKYASKHTLADIKNGIVDIQKQLDIDRMPTHQEIKDLGMKWLSREISKTGGSGQWAEFLGVELSKRNKNAMKTRLPIGYWTEEKILETAAPVAKELGRSPTASELNSRGLSKLTNAIRRHMGFSKLAKKLGVPEKRSCSQRAKIIEKRLSKIFQKRGITAALQTHKSPYDILINDEITVDVKMAVHSPSSGGFVYILGQKGYEPTCDVYAFCTVERETDRLLNVYFIPSSKLLQQTVTITKSFRWLPWLWNFDAVTNKDYEFNPHKDEDWEIDF